MKDDINQANLDHEANPVPNKDAIKQAFDSGADARILTVKDLERRLGKVLSVLVSPATIKVRTKKFSSYYRKYLHLLKSGMTKPLITDLMGIRIVCPFIEDLSFVEKLVIEKFDVLEVERKKHHTFKEFGYEATHLLIKIPPDISRVRGPTGSDVIEIQLRTILQDAWAEVEHEIFYKAEFNPVDMPMKRKLAAVAANLLLADIVFQEIRDYQKKLNGQLEKRRDTFYQKIEESTDALIISETPVINADQPQIFPVKNADFDNTSIDDLLLEALKAHNENRFKDAISIYTRILELKPDNMICSLIYKHRGMAHFAQSKYKEAVMDFDNALVFDPQSFRVAYYRGVVHSVIKQYLKAIDDFTLSLQINPYQAYCLFRRGQAYYHINDYPQALSDCEDSLAMEGENDAVKKFRELLQSKLKM